MHYAKVQTKKDDPSPRYIHLFRLRKFHKLEKQEISANAHEMRDSISLISYTGCLGLSPVYFSENSL